MSSLLFVLLSRLGVGAVVSMNVIIYKTFQKLSGKNTKDAKKKKKKQNDVYIISKEEYRYILISEVV